VRIWKLPAYSCNLLLQNFSMASLLSKFRIDYANLTMVHDVSDKPHPRTAKLFEDIIRPFKEGPDISHDKSKLECTAIN